VSGSLIRHLLITPAPSNGSSGAVVAKALVEAKAVATNLSRTTTTDAEGNYTLTSLPVGEYEVTISAAGFRKEVQRGITIQVQQRARLDVALQPGNWVVLGRTTGRGKNDLTHKPNRSIKEVLALPVHRRFRELLREAR